MIWGRTSRSRRREKELDAELQFHFAASVEEKVRSGMTAKEAIRNTRLEFGGMTQIKEDCRESLASRWSAHLMSDLRYGLRQLRKAPGFTLTAVLTLALGIGANAAVFSLIRETLLQNLPVPHPEQLVRIGDSGQFHLSVFSTEVYGQLRKNTTEFQELAAMQVNVSPGWFTLRRQGGDEIPHDRIGEWVSGNYFAMMGVAPTEGRLLQPSDDLAGAQMVAVMSHAMWQRDYAGDPRIIGSIFIINTHPVTIVGIAPKGFYGDRISANPPEFYLPLSTEPLLGEGDFSHDPKVRWLYVMGRTKPGIAIRPLEEKVTVLLIRSLSEFPFFSGQAGQERLKQIHLQVMPASSGIAVMQGYLVSGLHLLMWIAGLVLLIACANIANLVLARGLARRGEISVRIALGAARARLIRQALTESILLSCLGGLVGVGMAYGLSAMMLSVVFPHAKFSPMHAVPSPVVLAFAFGVSMLTGLLFGTAPAWATSHTQPSDALRGSNKATPRHTSLLQRSLVVLQASLSLVLLIGAGLLAKSLIKLQSQNFGMQTESRVVVHVNPQNAGFSTGQLQVVDDQIQDKMLSLPEVSQAGLALFAPLDGDDWGSSVRIQGAQPEPNGNTSSSWDRVSPGFFDAIGEPVLRGRNILSTDTADSPGVAVVNQAFVKRFFLHGENPIGQHFGTGDEKSTGDWEIVGVVADAKYQDPSGPQRPMFFLPILQRARSDTPQEYAREVRSLYIGAIVLAVKRPAPKLLQQVSRALESIHPDLNVINFQTMEEQVGDQLSQEKLMARLMLLFGFVALTLAAVGLYGVTSYTVAQRRSEIGIRMALGAKRSSVVWMVLRSAFTQAGIGLAVGLPLALLSVRYLKTQLYEVEGQDIGVMTTAIVTLAVAALIAGLIPARRAATIDPLEALRAE